jgi:hypothetical protein
MTTKTKPTMKHTPGPWVCVTDCVDAVLIGNEDRSVAVARVQSWAGEPKKTQREANAKLVAAAPELLEACMAAIAATGGSEVWDGETKAFLQLCEAAIAKAIT